MQKEELINIINSADFIDEVKDGILEELGQYPDTLSQEDLMKFDSFLKEIQVTEIQVAGLLEEMVEQSSKMDDQDEKDTQQFVEESVKMMHRELSTADEMVKALS
jgi:uncharacterized protein YpuA (DUF1002 family)